MTISLDDFHPLSLEDKQLFDKLYQQYPPVHSDYVFTTMISWMPYANYHMAKISDHLLLYTEIEGIRRFRPPLGTPKKPLLLETLHLANTHGNGDTPFGLIDSEQQQWMKQFYPNISFSDHREFYDYVYLSKDLVNLEGGDYRKIRNRLNKFTRSHPYTVESLSHDNFDDCRDFLKRWCLWRDCASDPFLEYEHQAILFAMDHFFDLGLQGICIRIHDEVEALAVYESMNPDTIVVHFEKGSPDYDGIYKAINRETAKRIEKNYRYVNRESDMGDPGLRRAKQSYRPDHFIHVAHLDKHEVSCLSSE